MKWSNMYKFPTYLECMRNILNAQTIFQTDGSFWTVSVKFQICIFFKNK